MTAPEKALSKALTDAQEAHTNLSVFGVVQTIMEGHLYGAQSSAAKRIITICKAEMQRQLHIMDKATAAAKGNP